MNDHQPWEFTCNTCEGHQLTVSRTWTILAGSDTENWQEWGPLEAAAESILHMRSQVIELQSHIRRLEAELTAEYASQHLRLSRYREVYYEATWIELEIRE